MIKYFRNPYFANSSKPFFIIHSLIINQRSILTGHNGAIYKLIKGTTPGTFFSAGGDGWLVEWNVDEPDLGKLFAKTDSKIFSLEYFPDMGYFAAGNMEGGIHWINAQTKQDEVNILHHQHGTFGFMDTPTGIFSLGGAGKITLWDKEKLKPLESLHLSNTSLRCIAEKPHYKDKGAGKTYAVGSSDRNIYFLNEYLEVVDTWEEAHNHSVFSLGFDPNQELLMSGGRDARLIARNFEGKIISDQNAHWYSIYAIAFRPDGRIFATASRDKTIRVWSAEDFSLLKELNMMKNQGHRNSVNTLLWLDNQTLISAGDDRTIIIWDVKLETES